MTSLAPRPIVRMVREIAALSRILDRRGLLCYIGAVAATAPEILRTGSLSPADARVDQRLTSFRVDALAPLQITGGVRVISLAREIYGRHCYTRLPGFQLESEDVVVDLGANVGVFTLFAARQARKVVAVEAQSGFMPILRGNVGRNIHRADVQVVWGLVGGDKGTFSLIGERHRSPFWQESPPVIPFDMLITDIEADVDFLKVDIEGSEFALFAESTPVLQRIRRIVMEVHPDYGDPQTIVSTLQAAGFHVTLVDSNGEVTKRIRSDVGFLYARRS